jgi:hypothetical protein
MGIWTLGTTAWSAANDSGLIVKKELVEYGDHGPDAHATLKK